MATTRLMPLHTGKGQKAGQAIRSIVEYVINPGKTERGELITSYACDHRTADAEFMLSKREYIARTGRIRGKDDVIAYHLRQSFVPGEITPQEANRWDRNWPDVLRMGSMRLSLPLIPIKSTSIIISFFIR